MRLPTDATLLIGPGAAPELEQVWREERLPVLTGEWREADLEATATVVVCGEEGARQAAAAAALGFRTFLVGETASPGVVAITLRQALDAARLARAVERWKAARSG